MTDEKDQTRHKARMQEQKAKVDERIAAAQEEKGLLLVLELAQPRRSRTIFTGGGYTG